METQMLWDNLVCKCGGIGFVQTVEIRWKPAGGTVPRPTGKYICGKCGDEVDILNLIAQKELETKKRELASLQERISSGNKELEAEKD